MSKVSLGAKQVSYIRESVKAIVEKLMETSVDNALDKKSEWTTQAKDIEDVELKQAIKTTLASTKGKHGRRTILQEEMSLDQILISDDKQALKKPSARHSTKWSTNTKPLTSRLRSSAHITLPLMRPFLFLFEPLATSREGSINMTLPNALTPSSIIMRKSFRHPRVQSGNVEEESFRI